MTFAMTRPVTLLAALACAVVGAPAASATTTAPVLSRLSQSAGPLSGGERITVSGSGFAHVRSVRFGTAAGRSVTVVSSTKLAVTVPKHAAGTVAVRVTTAPGRAS